MVKEITQKDVDVMVELIKLGLMGKMASQLKPKIIIDYFKEKKENGES